MLSLLVGLYEKYFSQYPRKYKKSKNAGIILDSWVYIEKSLYWTHILTKNGVCENIFSV